MDIVAILSNPIIDAALLIAVAIIGYCGRKTFGTIAQYAPHKRKRAVEVISTKDLKKLPGRFLDAVLPSMPQPEVSRYAEFLPSKAPANPMVPAVSASTLGPAVGAATKPVEKQAQVDPTQAAIQATVQAVKALPEAISWDIEKIAAGNIPILSNGKAWSYLSLHASEHAVICGASRSGKGNLLQMVGLSALLLGPDVAQVWFLDAKQGLDYSFATKLQHARLYADVRNINGKLLSDGGLTSGFQAVIGEMELRNNLMFSKARNIHEYRQKTGAVLPIIVLVVDEAAELDADQRAMLCTIARMGAAAGFVLLTSTQYPTAEVLPSQVQANALNRVCLKLSSGKYTPVALSLAPGERSTYEPAAIVPRGVAVFRHNGGQEVLGRVPEVTDGLRDEVIDRLVGLWPRTTEPVEPVRQKGQDSSLNLAVPNQFGRTSSSGSLQQEAVRSGSGLKSVNTRYELVRELVREGKSGNKINEILGGTRSDNLELVRQAKQELGLVDEE